MTDTSEWALLDEHVARFNSGVRSADWAPMLELFDDGAELDFEGVPVGPFVGREAIAAAYRERPPDDEIVLLSVRAAPGGCVADYAWRAAPGARAGELRLSVTGGRIARLVVTFG
ncbi:MAG: nuclear transport factor 2 family protein [Gaiellaceae bacterium]